MTPMKFSTFGSLCRAETKSRFSGNQFFRLHLEHLEDRRLLSVSPSVAGGSGGAIHVAVAVVPDLTIIKSDSAGGSSNLQSPTSSPAGTVAEISPGQSLTYTVVVSNAAAAAVDGVKIVDPLALTDFTETGWTSATSTGVTGSAGSGTGEINDTVDMPADSSITYTITGTVPSGATPGSTLTNIASVTPPNSGTAINATDTDDVAVIPLLAITKTRQRRRVEHHLYDRQRHARPVADLYGRRQQHGHGMRKRGRDHRSDAHYRIDRRHLDRLGHRGRHGFTASGSGNIDDTDVTLPAGSAITYTVTGTVTRRPRARCRTRPPSLRLTTPPFPRPITTTSPTCRSPKSTTRAGRASRHRPATLRPASR